MSTGTIMIDDPNVKIPAAVRAQADRANAIIGQINQPQASADGEDRDDGQQRQPDLQADALLNAPANPAPAQQPSQADDDAENWEHKYKSLHGRMTSLTSTNAQLTERVNNLQNVIAAMQAAAPERPTAELTFEDITEDERREYGEDLLGVVGKQAMKHVAPVLKQMQDQILQQSQTIRSLSGKQAQTEQGSVLDTLDNKLPTWREINTSDDFLAWLALPDAFSGDIRHDMLKKAFTAGDAPRVLAFFNGFLKDEAATSLTTKPLPDQNATRVAKVPLVDLAAPGKAKAAAQAPAAPDKPIINRTQIAAFYSDVAAGKYKGRDAEKDRAEAMIFSAQQDGRIR